MKKQDFIQIVNEHRGIIRSLCKVYFQRSEDQKDAFQDIILQLWKSHDTFRGASAISTWIYRVGLNTILTNIRRNKKSVAAEPLAESHLSLSNANADDHVELLTLILQALKDIDKAIVVLHLEGYRNKEIAEMLKMSPTNVATRFNRVKSHLKMKLNKGSYAPKQP